MRHVRRQQRQRQVQEQVSIILDDDDILDAFSETDEPDSPDLRTQAFSPLTSLGMIEIEEDMVEHEFVKSLFVPGMGPYASQTEVLAIHKIMNSGLNTTKARWGSFEIFADAVAKKREGIANVKFAWFAGSREEISNIVSHGFSLNAKPANGLPYGAGICLYPESLPLFGVESTENDDFGMRHMLLCRVILGNIEVVQPGSDQFHPSSGEFDSGVDNLLSPRRYVVWSAFMNSHIFPYYLVSFQANCLDGYVKRTTAKALRPIRKIKKPVIAEKPPSTMAPVRVPNSPWMSFPNLLAALSEFLSPPRMEMLTQYHADFRGKRITRADLIQRIRAVTGDNLLRSIIQENFNEDMHNRFLQQLAAANGD